MASSPSNRRKITAVIKKKHNDGVWVSLLIGRIYCNFQRSSHLHLLKTGVCTVATNIKVRDLKLPMKASPPDSRIRVFWSVLWLEKTESFFETSVSGNTWHACERYKILLNSVAVKISIHRPQFFTVLLNCVAPFSYRYFKSSYKQDIKLSWVQLWNFLHFL